ncbi:RNA-binding domain-containing protein [Raoultibacter phocaeensis]|uniref:RNA-binding domain-containing protein n=1 Tax=Raoultibacter phocaeensis TaxID=2479841 RepID=UPI00111AC8A0|nr:RNA-binding domain-containing protein [Raoultibacter phocaeensis]
MFSESDVIEFKREFSRTTLKTVVAFANTRGGIVYLGIEDDGEICGVEDPDATMLAAANSIRSSIKPNTSMIVQCERMEMNGKHVVGIRVERGANRPYYMADKGMRPEGVYIRQGSASFMATEAEIVDMLKASQKDSFEARRCLHQALTFSETSKAFENQKLEFGDAQLRTLGFVDEDGQFTNLAWLLSDQCTCSIKLAHFFGTKRITFKDRLETRGSLLAQFDQACHFLAEHTHYKTRFVDMRREDYDDYPPDAVREVLVNALVHQDFDSGAPPLVSVLEDRLETVSHGGLPASYSLSEFQMDVSVLRNPRLAHVFYRLGLIEAYGTGIARIFEAYERSETGPVFDITKHVFKVVLPNRNATHASDGEERGRRDIHGGDELGNQERLVFSVIEEQGPLKRSELQERFDFSQATLLRILKRLEEKGLVRAEGNTRRRVYRVLVAE